MSRKYQDTDFLINTLSGKRVLELKGLVDIEKPDNRPTVVNLKSNNNIWNRFFLDAGLAFWEEWENFEDFPEDEETKEIDYASLYELKDKVIISAECVDSEIKILFDNNILLSLRFIDSTDIDSDSELIIKTEQSNSL